MPGYRIQIVMMIEDRSYHAWLQNTNSNDDRR